MTITIPDRIATILSNPHTSISGLVFIACKVGQIWLPQYKSQFEATEGLAGAYGLVMAGDAKPQNPPPAQPPAAPEQHPPILPK